MVIVLGGAEWKNQKAGDLAITTATRTTVLGRCAPPEAEGLRKKSLNP